MIKVENKKRIGFVSYWGWSRGQAYVTLGYAKTLKDKYDVYILKQFANPITDEFKVVDVNITEYPKYDIDPEVFKKWVTENKLSAVVFNEYKQWSEDGINDLEPICHELGIKVYSYLVWEKFKNAETYQGFDRILTPTLSFGRLLRTNKFRKFTYVPYSIDLDVFPKKERKMNEVFTFFHPGGFGGVHNRKNTQLVIDAFMKLDNPKTKLIITSLVALEHVEDLPDNIEIISKNLSRQEMIDMYYKADAVLLPSKWETVGLPFLESLAAGTPVVTVNAPPMNEFIKEGLNGYVCNCRMQYYPDLGVKAAEITVIDYSIKMKNVMNEMLWPMLSRNSRQLIENDYSLEKNKKYLLDLLEADLE